MAFARVMPTPAFTMAAACKYAEIGVGASIASGSQVKSGTWADLAVAAMRRKTNAIAFGIGPSCPNTSKEKLPVKPKTIPNTAMKNTPPMWVMTKALKPARTAVGR